jgi:hypothetical protein
MTPRWSSVVLGAPSQPVEIVETRRLARRLLGGSGARLQAFEIIALGGPRRSPSRSPPLPPAPASARAREGDLALGSGLVRPNIQAKRGDSRMQCVGEVETTTARGKPIVMAVWERPCSVCGALFRLRLPKNTPPEYATSSTTCFEHSADKRKRRAKAKARARYRSPNRRRYRQ